MADNVEASETNSQSQEDQEEIMSMFASVWVKVEVGEDPADSEEKRSPARKKSKRKPNRARKILFCDLCDYSTIYKNCLELHIVGHTNAKPHSCQFCDYTTKYPTSLTRHILIQHQTKEPTSKRQPSLFKCDQCEYSSHFKWNLNAHKRKHKLEKQFKCSQCQYSTAYRHNFLKHGKVHGQGSFFKCDKCPFVTKFEGHITRHLAKIHNEVTEKANKCDVCDFSTKIRWRLNIHKQRSKQEDTLKCDFCEFETFYMCESKKHKVTHYNKIYRPIGTPQDRLKPFGSGLSQQDRDKIFSYVLPQESRGTCPSLPQNILDPVPQKSIEPVDDPTHSVNDEKSGRNQYMLDPDCVDWNSIQVLESDDKERPFLCHMCNYTSKFKAAVQRHFQRHHTGSQNRPYKCCNCDFSTKTKDQIALHNKRSKSDTVLLCKHCEFNTNFKCQFVMHQKCHYAYRCTLCTYSCRQKYELQKHYTTLHLGKGLKCSYCDYRAARKESLLCHETIHTGDKPYKCSLCPYMSVRKALLDNHVKRYHSEIKKDITIVSDSKIESLRVTMPLNLLENTFNECLNLPEGLNNMSQ